MPSSALMAKTLVALADNLVADFDVIDLLTLLTGGCVEVLDVSAAGLLLASPAGQLRVMASSSEELRLVELFEVQAQEGPCWDCFTSGLPVVNADVAATDSGWEGFGPRALAAGFRSVHALPMRLRGQTIGALNLFRSDAGELDPEDVIAAQAFADVATIAILQDRAVRQAQTVNEQLAQALNSRIVIEQAKGIVAQAAHVDMTTAFERLRATARSNNIKLAVVARAVIDGTISPTALGQAEKLPTGTADR
jgi:GAF domain-containing protein